jgi:hypothetical protein
MRYTVADDQNIPEDAKSYGFAKSGKVYWNRRNARGQFVRWDGSTGNADHDAHVESRIVQAERATRGNMVNAQGRERGMSVADIMRPGGGMRWATEELRDWLEIHGRTMSVREFLAQSMERCGNS